MTITDLDPGMIGGGRVLVRRRDGTEWVFRKLPYHTPPHLQNVLREWEQGDDSALGRYRAYMAEVARMFREREAEYRRTTDGDGDPADTFWRRP